MRHTQDIEKWRAREATGPNFFFLYCYKIVAGLTYYHVRLATMHHDHNPCQKHACTCCGDASPLSRTGLWP